MVIELYTQEILNDLRTKCHYEVAQIADVEARYRVEAGTEKMEDVKRCVAEAMDRLRHRCIRYLEEEIVDRMDNALFFRDKYTFNLILSERRAIGKTQPLAEAMHTFAVEYALSKFYSDVAMQDLSNKHSMLAVEAGDRIDDMLYTKMPPRV